MVRAEGQSLCSRSPIEVAARRVLELPTCGSSTIGAIVLVVIVYPMTVAGLGPLSNGGALGLFVLSIHSLLVGPDGILAAEPTDEREPEEAGSARFARQRQLPAALSETLNLTASRSHRW